MKRVLKKDRDKFVIGKAKGSYTMVNPVIVRDSNVPLIIAINSVKVV